VWIFQSSLKRLKIAWRYVQESGSKAVISRFEREETIYTSVLRFAEVRAAIGRKRRNKEWGAHGKQRLVDELSSSASLTAS
jgi:predicted nucleic acid-binding protein